VVTHFPNGHVASVKSVFNLPFLNNQFRLAVIKDSMLPLESWTFAFLSFVVVIEFIFCAFDKGMRVKRDGDESFSESPYHSHCELCTIVV